MSQSYRKRQKAKKEARTIEERELRNKIRKGTMPAFHLAKDAKDMNKMETELVWKGRYKLEPQEDKTVKRVKALEPKRTWRQVSTLAALRPEASPKTQDDYTAEAHAAIAATEGSES